MAWLARSFTNSLRLDDDDGGDDDDSGAENDVASPTNRDGLPHASSSSHMAREEHDADLRVRSPEEEDEEEAQSRGVKEDLSELRETLARQLWGVASFLAPPPRTSDLQSQLFGQSDGSGEDEVRSDDGGEAVSRLNSDFGEIGGRFRRMASNLMSIGPEEEEIDELEIGSRDLAINEDENEMEGHHDGYDDQEDDDLGKIVEGTVGITEEVLAFAMNIAHHPETWLDFPLEAEDDLDDFKMTGAQQKHAMFIEHLAPRLAALRIELCPCHMNKSYFWKVYFVLLHSRLDKHDAEILSTPQVMEARAMWMKELQKKTKPDFEWWGSSVSHSKESEVEDNLAPYSPRNIHSHTVAQRSCSYEHPTPVKTIDCETEKYPVESSEMKIVDKSVIQEKPVNKSETKRVNVYAPSKFQIQTYEDDEDDWPEEDIDFNCNSKTSIPLGDVDDISFSDLEDDDDDVKKIVSKKRQL